MSRVALVKGEDRHSIILRALNLAKDDIKKSLGSRNVVIKPNFVSTTIQLAATHADCIRAVLDFFSGLQKKKVIIGEISSSSSTDKGYRNFGYYKLKEDYDIELVDLNDDEFETVNVDFGGKSAKFRISKTLINPKNYVVSAAMLKVHDTVVATLSLKNLVVGAIKRDEKCNIHMGVPEINKIIAQLAKTAKPDLAVIDGFEGMEGEGPCFGTPVNTKVAIASTDFLAADRVGLEIMGIDPSKVGYLNYCHDEGLGEYDISRIKVIGDEISKCRKKFRLHSTAAEQFRWK